MVEEVFEFFFILIGETICHNLDLCFVTDNVEEDQLVSMFSNCHHTPSKSLRNIFEECFLVFAELSVSLHKLINAQSSIEFVRVRVFTLVTA